MIAYPTCPHVCSEFRWGSGEAERQFRRDAERHSGMIPKTIGAKREGRPHARISFGSMAAASGIGTDPPAFGTLGCAAGVVVFLMLDHR